MNKLYILIFILKLLDCLLTTTKTKALIYGYDKLAGILKSIATVTNALILMNVVISKSYIGIVIMGVAEFLGTIIATQLFNKVNSRYKQDETWTYFVVPKTREYSKIIADTLKEYNIKTFTLEGYNNKQSVLSSIVYAKTKEESVFIKELCYKKAYCQKL